MTEVLVSRAELSSVQRVGLWILTAVILLPGLLLSLTAGSAYPGLASMALLVLMLFAAVRLRPLVLLSRDGVRISGGFLADARIRWEHVSDARPEPHPVGSSPLGHGIREGVHLYLTAGPAVRLTTVDAEYLVSTPTPEALAAELRAPRPDRGTLADPHL
ncbi:hypothetical protein [Nesterenkonia marinintestina]|uniref:hypothetical protein n=1 Tax=Nesterenkonia marinintestina TaxID=2979865 RepID=UPI0021C1DB5C|nr:hypothetical protein [Nesterenkonia sp. GX14115]